MLLQIVFQQTLENFYGSFGITASPVPVKDLDIQGITKFAQAVGGKAREDLATQSYRAKSFGIVLIARRRKMAFYKRVIEIDVMGDKDLIVQDAVDLFGQVFKNRSLFYHFIRDAGHRLDIGRNWLAGIDQCLKFFYDLASIENMNRNFRDAVGGGITSGCFDIDDGVH